MATAALDQDSKQTATARLKTDGVTITRLKGDSSGILQTTTTTSGAVIPSTFAATDDNGRMSLFAVSENDSKVLVALQCDASGNLLIKMI